MSVLMMWGPFVFQAGGAAYEELAHKWGGRWKDHEVIGRRPAGQFTGPAEETISLKGTIFPHDDLTGGANMIIDMQIAAGAGEVFPLVSGTGQMFGRYRLKEVTRNESHIGPSGVAMKLSYDLQFVLQDEDEGAIAALWP